MNSRVAIPRNWPLPARILWLAFWSALVAVAFWFASSQANAQDQWISCGCDWEPNYNMLAAPAWVEFSAVLDDKQMFSVESTTNFVQWHRVLGLIGAAQGATQAEANPCFYRGAYFQRRTITFTGTNDYLFEVLSNGTWTLVFETNAGPFSFWLSTGPDGTIPLRGRARGSLLASVIQVTNRVPPRLQIARFQ